jgi:hypothetical protein
LIYGQCLGFFQNGQQELLAIFLCTTVVINQGKLEQIRVHSWLIFLRGLIAIKNQSNAQGG